MYQESPNNHRSYRHADTLKRRLSDSRDSPSKHHLHRQRHQHPFQTHLQKQPQPQQAQARSSLDPDNIAYKTIVKEDVDKDQGTFRIPALGGYDPEEDYRESLRDMNNERPNIDMNNQDIMDVQASGYDSQDIAFDSGPVSKDEIIFNDGTEDPDAAYEPSGIGKDEIKQDATNDQQEPDREEKRRDFDDDDIGDVVEKQEKETKPRARSDTDPDEGDWVNDGVDDIEIPAQTQQDEATDDSGGGASANNNQEGSPDDAGSPTNLEETLDGGSGDDNGKQTTDSDRRTNIQDANDGATGSNDHESNDDSETKPKQSRVYQEAGVRNGPKPTKSSSRVSRRKQSVDTPVRWTNDMHKAWADESKNEWPGPPALEE